MTGVNYITQSPVYRLYQEELELGITTLTFLQWEEMMEIEHPAVNNRLARKARNNRRHMARKDDMKKRLRQKLEERKKNKSN